MATYVGSAPEPRFGVPVKKLNHTCNSTKVPPTPLGVLLPLPNLRPSSSTSFCLFSSFFQLQSKLQDHPTQLELIDLVRPFGASFTNSWKRSRSLNSVIAKRREKIAPFPRWKSLKLFPNYSQTGTLRLAGPTTQGSRRGRPEEAQRSLARPSLPVSSQSQRKASRLPSWTLQAALNYFVYLGQETNWRS